MKKMILAPKKKAIKSEKPAAKAKTETSRVILKGEERPMARNLGKAIKKLRSELKLTQADVGEATDLWPAYIAMVEQGRRTVSPSLLNWILQQYQAPVSLQGIEAAKKQFKVNPKWTTEVLESFLTQLLKKPLPGKSKKQATSFEHTFTYGNLDVSISISKHGKR
jgi:transcriptional regulator with XRE-family HTH domain